MAYINKQDTNGTKATLLKGEFGYDDYAAGGDTGRVYVGNGTENIPLSKESEVYKKEEVDSKDNAIITDNNRAYGYTKYVSVDDRFLETDTPNVLVDKIGDDVRFSDGLYERLGAELVTNGDFSDGATGWVIRYGAKSDGVFTSSGIGATDEIEQTFATVVGRTYMWTITYNTPVSGNMMARITTGSTWINNAWMTSLSGVNYLTFTFVAEATTATFTGGGYIAGATFDNISVKELPQATLPVAPFAPTSTDELITGYGDELVTNGTFDSESAWTKGTGWSIGSGVATKTSGSASELTQNVSLSNIPYIVTFIVSNYTSGSVTFRTGGGSFVNGTLTSGDGTYSEIITPASGCTFIDFAASVDFVGSIDNISVKEVESQVECKEAHSKGDIVVTGNELVTNGTFDTDTTGWTGRNGGETLSVVSGKLRVNQALVDYGGADQILSGLTIGEIYVVTYEFTKSTIDGYFYVRNSVDTTSLYASGVLSASGSVTSTFTATETSAILRCQVQGTTDNAYTEWDNISVKLKDNIYQATVDTADMYDYTTDDGAVPFPNGTVIKVGTTHHVNVTTGDYYWIRSSGSSTPFDFANYDFTTSLALYPLIGTASTMSLQNPYFQTLDKVTRQDVMLLTKTGYKTVKGIHYFGETYSNDDVATAYGWSKLGNNLYHDGVEEVIVVGVRGTLNAGGFHPVYNVMGTEYLRNNTNGGASYWYTTSTLLEPSPTIYTLFDFSLIGQNVTTPTGIADVLYGTVIKGTTTGRPDSKYYDKVYLEGQGGIAPSALPYAGKLEDIMFDKAVQSDIAGGSGLQEGVEIIAADLTVSFTGGATGYRVVTGVLLFSHIESYGGAPARRALAFNGTQWQKVSYEQNTVDSYISTQWRNLDWTDNVPMSGTYTKVIVLDTNPALLTRKSATHTDIIGNPANYPTDWLSHLASGKSIGFANALLVGQDGTDYTNFATYNTIGKITLSKKGVEDLQHLYIDGDMATIGTTTPLGIGIDNTTNDGNSTSSTRKWLLSYTSANQTAPQTDPQKVVKVYPQVIASNSHSIYKGALLTNACTGKVSVGNGSNGFESRVLENGDYGVTSDIFFPSGTNEGYTTVTYFDVTPLMASASEDLGSTDETVSIGKIVTPSGTYDISRVYYSNSSRTIARGTISAGDFRGSISSNVGQILIDGFQATPSHNTINLDNSNSPASKSIPALVEFDNGEYGVSYMQEEMIWDYDVDGGSEFVNITESTNIDTQYATNKYINVTNGRFSGYWVMLKDSGSAVLSDELFYEDDKKLYYSNESNGAFAVRWDGNGFGEDNTFSQLTNGTITDLNGNTVQTKIVSKRLGVFA